MAKQLVDLAKLCEALGIERVNEVTRAVLDVRAGHVPMLLVERIADTEKVIAALTGPGIEVRRDDPGAAVKQVEHLQVRTCACTAGDACNVPWHWQQSNIGAGRPPESSPVVHGNVSGANIAWGNGSVVQNS